MLLTIFLLLLAALIWIYNILIQDRNRVKAAWSDIDVQLKKRHDLVPQLVTCVKAYADHERATLEAVTELRKQSEVARRLPEKAAVEDQMERALHQLIVVAEAYPDLKSDSNFRQLQAELVEVEDHLQFARRYYNGAVKIFNIHIQSFPHLLVARPFRFTEVEYFAVEDAKERQAPPVEL